MKNKHLILLLLAVLVLAIGSCVKSPTLAKRTPNLPATPYHYAVGSMAIIIPPGNPYVNGGNSGDSSQLDNTPQTNPTSDAGATLGRVLFYETLFSLNNSISCGSCHKQQNGFADVVPVSLGFEGQKGSRNAFALANENMNSNFFWDGRANTLESQTIMPVQNHAELGMENLDNLVKKLQSAPYYPALFKAAFGSSEITKQGISEALAQFMRSMHSFSSKFDKGASSGFSNFTQEEVNGEATFRAMKCNSCHGGNNLDNGGLGMDHNMPSGNDWANGGLDIGFPDVGLMGTTHQTADNGVFKIPSLRNVAVTAPYMHDGRFQTLEQVVEHYNSGVQANPNLDLRLTQGSFDGTTNTAPVRMNMTAQQKSDLVAFLNTLTDYEFLSDPKFSDPFK
jgi:cytochrome c peroxidase